jgi:hypothetical protein
MSKEEPIENFLLFKINKTFLREAKRQSQRSQAGGYDGEVIFCASSQGRSDLDGPGAAASH